LSEVPTTKKKENREQGFLETTTTTSIRETKPSAAKSVDRQRGERGDIFLIQGRKMSIR